MCDVCCRGAKGEMSRVGSIRRTSATRSEEHTSELQSRPHLECRLLLEKQNSRLQHEPIDAHRFWRRMRSSGNALTPTLMYRSGVQGSYDAVPTGSGRRTT